MPSAPFAWTHEKTRVEFDGQALTIKDRRIPLGEVERVARILSRSTAQGSWNRLDCQLHLLADGKVADVRFHGDASTVEWGPWRPLWDQLDALVRDEIEPRLLNRTIAQVTAGSPAEIGGGTAKGRGRITVTAESLQTRKMFSKPIPWSAITDIVGGVDMQVVTTEPSGKARKHSLGIGSSSWDAWQIPLLWQHFGAG